MEHISFGLGLLLYSAAPVNLLLLVLLWKKSRDPGIFWTILLILSFTLLQLGMIFFDYLRAIGLLLNQHGFGVRSIGLLMDLISLSMVFTVPRFSWSMFTRESWPSVIPRIIFPLLLATGVLHCWSSLHREPVFSWTSRLLYLFLLISIATTLLLILLAVALNKKSSQHHHTWYTDVALSMARIGLFFIPLFCLLDFFPSLTPWEKVNRFLSFFSAVPLFNFIWNIKLIRGAVAAGALSKDSSIPVENLTQWMQVKELTPREQEVALMLIQGKNYADICDTLCLSRATVKSHTNRIYRKTGLSNQVSLIKKAGGSGD